MIKQLFAPALGLTLFLASGCGPIPHTGFEVRVHPPDATKLMAGKDFNTLYVDVVSDGVEQSFTTPVGAGTRMVEGNYVVAVTMDGEKHIKADITVSLKNDDTVIRSVIKSEIPVVQGEFTVYNIDFTSTTP